MHKIETCHKKNTLLIYLNDFQGSNRELFVSEIERASASLSPGFSCIIILSKYTIASGKELQNLENLLYAYGLESIVYIDERKDIAVSGENHVSCNREDIGIHQATTLEEAEKMLSSKQYHEFALQ